MDPRDRKYTNKEISVYWKPRECIHSSVCYMKLLEVFNPRKRPWVNMQGAPSAKIIEIVNQCPTEALTWKWNDNEKNKQVTEADTNHIKIRRPDDFDPEEEEEEVVQFDANEPIKIQVMNDGPYLVEGSYLLVNSDGSKVNMKGISSLCRCGASNSMPFCDGTHKQIGVRN
jgi:uncharacterized Fe-S cluster protein YjdI